MDVNEVAWANRLHVMGLQVQRHIVKTMQNGAHVGLREVVAEEAGDRIYAIDRAVEPILEAQIQTWPDECFPLLLIAEGLGQDGRQRFGPVDRPIRFHVIVDPIDGTRMLMYDKRSAWFLAAVIEEPSATSQLAPNRSVGIADSLASAIVELPTSKQHLADSFVATRTQPFQPLEVHNDDSTQTHIECRRANCLVDVTEASDCETAETANYQAIEICPSQARDLKDGFVSVMACFPGVKQLAASLVDAIAERTGALTAIPEFFDDQYISTGGQMVELMTGKDRCVIDLRPLFNQILGRTGSDRFLESHPYDIAGSLAAQQAGVEITDGFGRELTAPLDVTTGVHWCGYANPTLREIVEPVVQDWLRSHGVQML